MTDMNDKGNEYVAILDAGSQYGKVIDRKIRELRVESRIMPLNTPTETLRQDPLLKGILISGGPSSIHDADAPAFNNDLFEVGKPVLGICYGMQLLVDVFKGKVGQEALREDGQDEISIDVVSPLFGGMKATEKVLLTHGDSATDAGPVLSVIARSSANVIAAVQHPTLPLFGVQFHPEVELTENGMQIFNNFLTLCGCQFNFTMEDREAVAIRMIQERTKQGQKVLCLASGGVDSTVCAVLLLKALGPERVVCVHIDHGFMRLRESEEVVAALKGAGVHVTLVDARRQFAEATAEMPARKNRPAYLTGKLCEAVEPEEKRVIIGNTFMSVCDAVIKDLGLDVENLLLAQGTLRPDLIESGSKYASKSADAIKTHHNDTDVVRQLRDAGRIIEPLCDYHKDEVREIGARLGIPLHLVQRQPFPGPGLAIRTLCSDGTPHRDEHYEMTEQIVRKICAGDESITQILEPLRHSLLNLQLASCVLPLRTVGVQGDGRTYAYAAGISMGAFPSAQEWDILSRLAIVIPKIAQHVNRVVFLFGSRHAEASCRVTKTTLVPEVLDKLREADNVVNQVLMQHNLVRRLSQVPVVLLPIGFENGEFSIVVRTFVTNDFMTGVPALPGSSLMPLEALREIVEKLEKLDFVSRVMYDLTGKPPGTTEWE